MTSTETAASPPKKRIVIACGGTGGHLYPGIAVAETLRARGHETMVLISEKNIDSLAATGHSHLTFAKVPAVPLPRPWSPKMIKFISSNLQAWRQCQKLFKSFQAEVVLGMGGFTCTVPLMVGRRRGCRTFIHESNAIPGKANRLNARFSNLVLLGFAECETHFPNRRCEVVGTPLRPALAKAVDQREARYRFHLQPDLPVVLVMGGSQGARGVNRNVAAALPFLKDKGVQILHITGPGEFDDLSKSYVDCGVPHHVAPFCHEMEQAYAAADLMVARSGASTLSEIAWFGLPSILIPYPHAAEDHQTRNAEIFSKAGAGKLVTEPTLSGEAMARIILDTLGDRVALGQMGECASGLAVRNAAERIAELLVGRL